MARVSFWLKAAAAAALLGVLAAGAVVIALKTLLPEPKLRALVQDAARRQLRREVRLQGVGVGLGGVSLSGLEISESPDFSAGTFLRVERFRLRPSWRALLRRRLVVAAVSAEGPSVRVVRAKNGRFNFETLAPSAPAAAAPSSAEGALPADFGVRRASIARGRVEYRDEAAGAAWTLSDFDLDLKNFAPSGPFDLKTSLRAQGRASGRPVDALLSFAGRADLAGGRPGGFRAQIKSLTVEQKGFKFAASGKVERLDAPRAALEAVLSASGKRLLQVSGSVDLSTMTAAADVSADLKAETPGLDTRLASALIPGAGIPALNLPPIQASLSASRRGDVLAVKVLRASWAGGKIDGSGSVRGLGSAKPVIAGEAALSADVPEVKPGQYPFLNLPPKLSIPAGHVDAKLALAGDELRLTPLSVRAGFGSATVSGSVRRLSSAKPIPDLSVSLNLNLPSVKISELPVAVAALPSSLILPAARVDGVVKIKSDDLELLGLTVKTSAGEARLDGAVAKALAGTPEPALDAAATLDLPALTDADLPFPGVPAGLRLPPTKWDARLSYSSRAVKIQELRLRAAGNDFAVAGSIAEPLGRRAFDLVVKCRGFSLAELTQMTPLTRDLQLAGTGFFALSVTGTQETPAFAGKGRFQGLSATIAELPLSGFGGTLSADQRRLDIPDLQGKVADGTLRADVTVKDYARAPALEVEASLDRFDLGRYLGAKKTLAGRAAAPSPAAPSRPAAPARPLRAKGRAAIGTLLHPNATVENVQASWDLSGITPDLRSLGGEARLRVGGGKLHAVGEMAEQSKVVKVLVFPLLIVQKLGRLGGIRLFPDFNDITLRGIAGDYAFKDGVMTLRQAEMDSDAAQVWARGSIDLPAEALNLMVTAQVANVAPIEVAVTGTASQPKTKVNVLKFLADPAGQLLKGLLKR